jgi:hypothetical protein
LPQRTLTRGPCLTWSQRRTALPTPAGELKPSGIKSETPCADVFKLKDGKVEVFNCYPEVISTLAQLGVLTNLEAAVAR